MTKCKDCFLATDEQFKKRKPMEYKCSICKETKQSEVIFSEDIKDLICDDCYTFLD
jgi:hypothetical protein